MKLLRIAILTLCAISSGCVIVIHESAGTKTTYISPAFGKKSISEADFQKGTIKGYQSEQVQMTEAIAAGVAKGMRP
jgi:hypothetical protein